MSDRLRLAIVASHPIQYQAPWFAALAKSVDLEVLYCHRQDAAGQAAAGFDHGFEWDIPLFEGYAFRWLENIAPTPNVEVFSGCDTPGVSDVIRAGRFDACLVTGWYLKSFVQAIRACRRNGIPVLVRGDSQLATYRHPLKRALKYWPYRWFLSRIDAHLYVGQANRQYLKHYGVDDARLFFVPHFVDNQRFTMAATSARTNGDAAALRSNHGIGPADVVFLFVGKLLERKRVHDFLAALARLKRHGLSAHGFIVGTGPQEPALRRDAIESGAPIHFLGFRNQSELPCCYAASDCLVLPSAASETWGLVINEAMACGIPAIVSDAVGSVADMIIEGRTGYRFACGDVGALMQRMRTFVACDRQHFADAVTRHIAEYACDPAVKGTMRALNFVLSECDRPSSQPRRTVECTFNDFSN